MAASAGRHRALQMGQRADSILPMRSSCRSDGRRRPGVPRRPPAEPLPHQIEAVYGEMLTRQPLRFLLADDPGAGKTIMTGLLIKELLIRGDLHRCLIVCPGMLGEQWKDELDRRFHLPFEIMTTEALEASRTGNWFLEHPLA